VFDDLLRAAPKVSTGASHVFAKVFAAAQYATVLDVVAHALAGLLYLRTALLHLSPGGVVVLLSDAMHRGQG